MRNSLEPKQCYILCKTAGFVLLFAYWVESGETTGFFLLLFLVTMSLLRWRIPKSRLSVFIDFAVCATSFAIVDMPLMITAFPLFEAMYSGYYCSAFALIYLLFMFEPFTLAIFTLIVICGFFLNCWERERRERLLVRDAEAGRYYELESLQSDLVAALAQIEHMTAVHERARIARDIHDNAGHEIVAAYISFQAVKDLLPADAPELSELYDAALERLNTGTDKIREAVHNLGAAGFFGVDRLRQKCENFTACEVDFKVYGDTTKIPIYIWSMLESCLSETLTNVVRHSSASWVSAELDATPYIVRLCVENDGIRLNEKPPGSGLRNLRHRAAAIGGSLSVDIGEIFSVICVIPVSSQGGNYETADC